MNKLLAFMFDIAPAFFFAAAYRLGGHDVVWLFAALASIINAKGNQILGEIKEDA
jgi:hypothetical protein